jgi:HD superfamily phosphodiesterase
MNTKQNLLMQELFKQAEPYLKMRNDFIHTRVAHDFALLLLEKEGGNRNIVEPAIILHDVGWSSLKPQDIAHAYGLKATGAKARELNRVHEVQGAIIAQEILTKQGYDKATIHQIVQIIKRHDSGKNPDTTEEKLVKDADKLWRFSKIGYHYELQRQATTHSERSAFLSKKIDSWFFTQTAKAMAAKELQTRDKDFL